MFHFPTQAMVEPLPGGRLADWSFHDLVRPELEGAAPCALHTATMFSEGGGYELAVFHACHASSPRAVLENLSTRMPMRYLPLVVVRKGIDLDHPVVLRLVPEPMRRRLSEIGDCDPSARPLAFGGCIHIAEHVAV